MKLQLCRNRTNMSSSLFLKYINNFTLRKEYALVIGWQTILCTWYSTCGKYDVYFVKQMILTHVDRCWNRTDIFPTILEIDTWWWINYISYELLALCIVCYIWKYNYFLYVLIYIWCIQRSGFWIGKNIEIYTCNWHITKKKKKIEMRIVKY